MPDQTLGRSFLDAAAELIPEDLTQSPQGQLRRAVSSCYYSVFHALAKACADALVGSDQANRSDDAWVEVYRGLDHGKCLSACEGSLKVRFPETLKSFANDFMQLQIARHRADYDPMARIDCVGALACYGVAEGCLDALNQTREKDMVAFATWLLITSKGAAHARKLKKDQAPRDIVVTTPARPTT